MASVTLTRVWLHDATDLSNYLVLPWLAASEDLTVPGTVRTYANGRRRSVQRAGEVKRLPYTFPYVSASDMAELRERVGNLQMLRDSRGRLEWGQFWDLRITERPTSTIGSAAFTFEVVTYSEAV